MVLLVGNMTSMTSMMRMMVRAVWCLILRIQMHNNLLVSMSTSLDNLGNWSNLGNFDSFDMS